jgi:hypothetical protein
LRHRLSVELHVLVLQWRPGRREEMHGSVGRRTNGPGSLRLPAQRRVSSSSGRGCIVCGQLKQAPEVKRTHHGRDD